MKLKFRENNKLSETLPGDTGCWGGGESGRKAAPDGGGGRWLQHGCCLFFAPKPSFFLEHLSLSTS